MTTVTRWPVFINALPPDRGGEVVINPANVLTVAPSADARTTVIRMLHGHIEIVQDHWMDVAAQLGGQQA